MTGALIFLGLGSNLGDRERYLERARERLQTLELCKNLRASHVVESVAIGPVQPDFLNQVIAGETEVPPVELYHAIKRIEVELGRTPGDRWGPRVIDIDILAYGDSAVRTPELTIPHAGIEEREFVLAPWAELDRDFRLPGAQQTIGELLRELRARRGNSGAGRLIDR